MEEKKLYTQEEVDLITGSVYAEAYNAGLNDNGHKPQTETGWVKAEISEIDKARFWIKVNVTDYCWEWSANRCQDGYGMFKLNGKDVKASRVAYAIVNGKIPDDLHVLHKCDNPCCVNPDHLFTGTHQDNMLDRQRKGRGKVLGRASRYHGVAFRKDSNNWRAQAFDGKKHVSLGSYKTEEEAAKARDMLINTPMAFHYLLRQGFDLFGLIPAGLAIDAKTVKQ